jgi:hypothetical protein
VALICACGAAWSGGVFAFVRLARLLVNCRPVFGLRDGLALGLRGFQPCRLGALDFAHGFLRGVSESGTKLEVGNVRHSAVVLGTEKYVDMVIRHYSSSNSKLLRLRRRLVVAGEVQSRAARQGKFYQLRLLDSLGSVEHLNGKQLTSTIVIQNQARLRLIAFGHAALA